MDTKTKKFVIETKKSLKEIKGLLEVIPNSFELYRYQNCIWYIETQLEKDQLKFVFEPSMIMEI